MSTSISKSRRFFESNRRPINRRGFFIDLFSMSEIKGSTYFRARCALGYKINRHVRIFLSYSTFPRRCLANAALHDRPPAKKVKLFSARYIPKLSRISFLFASQHALVFWKVVFSTSCFLPSQSLSFYTHLWAGLTCTLGLSCLALLLLRSADAALAVTAFER